MIKKLGAEIILLGMILPFSVWIVSSIYDLRASVSDITEMKEDVKIIKVCLITGQCRK